MTSASIELPPEPERPDCCAGGCAVCVLDTYWEEMQRWREQVEALRAAHAAAQQQLPSPD